jgi:hypothetical protein
MVHSARRGEQDVFSAGAQNFRRSQWQKSAFLVTKNLMMFCERSAKGGFENMDWFILMFLIRLIVLTWFGSRIWNVGKDVRRES